MKKIFCMIILLLVSLSSSPISAKTYYSCDGTPWKWPRDLEKADIFNILSNTVRKKVISMAFYEMLHESEKSMILPLTLYLANTEVNSKERGFWKTMSYISVQGKVPESVYESWPKDRGVKKISLSENEICKYFNSIKK